MTLLYFDGCPSWQTTDHHLRVLADELDLTLSYRKVEDPDDADAVDFRGSPTVLVEGRDPFAGEDDGVGLTCRVYPTPDGLAGSPTLEQLREVLTAS